LPKLFLSSVPSESWRTTTGAPLLDDVESWGSTRLKVLERDSFTCAFCGFRSAKYMEVHHIEGRHGDDSPENLVCVCPFCHSCLHIGFSGAVKRGVLLVLRSGVAFSQSEMNRKLLEAVRSRTRGGWSKIRSSLDILEDRGSDGLAMLGDLVAMSGKHPPENLAFFPLPEKYPIVAWLSGERAKGKGRGKIGRAS